MLNTKLLAAFAGVALLAACNTPPAQTTNGNGNGNGGTTQASGATPGSQEDLVAKGIDRVFFSTAASNLSTDARGTLDSQVAFFTQYAQDNIEVSGNCDERGTTEYNIALGQRRANSARDYLVAKGVAGSRIQTISYGKDRPTATGSDESAWQQNRNAITSVR